MTKPFIYHQNNISVLTPQLREKTKTMKIVSAFKHSGTTSKNENAYANLLPRVPMARYKVFTCDKDKGTYNHHSGICKWKDRYYYVFSNGFVNEDAPPQSTLVCSSDDGETWSKPITVAAGSVDEGVFMRSGVIFAYKDKLIVFAQKNWNLKAAVRPGMSVHDDTAVQCQIDAYVSSDGVNWQLERECLIPSCWTFEEPRLTSSGRLLGPGTDTIKFTPTVLLWPGDDPLEKPEAIHIPFHTEDMSDKKEFSNPQGGHFPYGESSWYQDDDGRIWMYMRDEGASEKLFISISEDGGQTWTQPMISDMPDSMSRIYVGRFNDGRYFLVGNSVSNLMDRSTLMLSVSDDGATFNKMYILVDDATSQSHEGHLKANGYQYPNCLIDGDRLFIAYSINKEDMECGIVNTADI